jgi:hypothetical protein
MSLSSVTPFGRLCRDGPVGEVERLFLHQNASTLPGGNLSPTASPPSAGTTIQSRTLPKTLSANTRGRCPPYRALKERKDGWMRFLTGTACTELHHGHRPPHGLPAAHQPDVLARDQHGRVGAGPRLRRDLGRGGGRRAHRRHPQDARARHDPGPDTDLRLVHAGQRGQTRAGFMASRPASSGAWTCARASPLSSRPRPSGPGRYSRSRRVWASTTRTSTRRSSVPTPSAWPILPGAG